MAAIMDADTVFGAVAAAVAAYRDALLALLLRSYLSLAIMLILFAVTLGMAKAGEWVWEVTPHIPTPHF